MIKRRRIIKENTENDYGHIKSMVKPSVDLKKRLIFSLVAVNFKFMSSAFLSSCDYF